MPSLESSNLASYTYNPATQNLSITFSRGDTYTYWGVDPETVAGLQFAGSVGKYFNANIRGQYSFTRRGSGGRFLYRRKPG
jgi:lysyl-tRNA synthetase class 2